MSEGRQISNRPRGAVSFCNSIRSACLPKSPRIARRRSNTCWQQPQAATSRATLGYFGPDPVEIAPNSVDLGTADIDPTSLEVAPTLIEVGPMFAKSGRVWPSFGLIGPTLDRIPTRSAASCRPPMPPRRPKAPRRRQRSPRAPERRQVIAFGGPPRVDLWLRLFALGSAQSPCVSERQVSQTTALRRHSARNVVYRTNAPRAPLGMHAERREREPAGNDPDK